MTEAHHEYAAIAPFVAALSYLDAGGLAVLRRAAGQSLAEARGSYGVFFPLLPAVVSRPANQEVFFLVATLYGVATRGKDVRRARVGCSLGLALNAVRQAQLNALGARTDAKISLDRRVAALVEADLEQLPFRLRQIVRLLHSRDQVLDWAQLLRDLLSWGRPDRSVQRRWMREYFVANAGETLSTNKERTP